MSENNKHAGAYTGADDAETVAKTVGLCGKDEAVKALQRLVARPEPEQSSDSEGDASQRDS